MISPIDAAVITPAAIPHSSGRQRSVRAGPSQATGSAPRPVASAVTQASRKTVSNATGADYGSTRREPVYHAPAPRANLAVQMISTNQLKNGNHIEVDGTVFKVVDFQHVKPGKGPAFVRTKLRRTSDGNVIDKTFRAGEKFRSVRSEARRMSFLYSDGTEAHFMDSESFEQIAVPVALVEDELRWTKPNDDIDILFIDSEPSTLQLPASVELEVTETEPGLRGDTASGGGNKPATLETGAIIQVPLFVNIGDKIKVQTDSGDYMSRA